MYGTETAVARSIRPVLIRRLSTSAGGRRSPLPATVVPGCQFEVASAIDLQLADRSLGGVLGWWSLFNLPREVLPSVLSSFRSALVPGGQLIVATHVGDDDLARTEDYGGVPVSWTIYQWQPEQLAALVRDDGLRPVAELRLAPDGQSGPAVVLVAQRDD